MEKTIRGSPLYTFGLIVLETDVGSQKADDNSENPELRDDTKKNLKENLLDMHVKIIDLELIKDSLAIIQKQCVWHQLF
jgi:hypothetical protein